MRGRWTSRLYWLAVGLLVVAIVADPRGLRRSLKLRHDAEQIAVGNARLEAENQKLAREVHALSTNPKYIQRAAREELGFVKPGELLLELDANGSGGESPHPPAARQP